MWASEQRAEQARIEREKQRRDREMAMDEMRMSGLLRDLYESQREVCIVVRDGSRVRGHITETGSDYCAVGTPGFGSALIALKAIDGVELDDATELVPSDRSLEASRTLTTAIDSFRNLRVRLTLTSGTPAVNGRVDGIGHDIVRLSLDGEANRQVFVPVAHIATLASA